ncbi:kinase [Pseudomonas phage ALEA]|uniref:Deoxynucleoside monophosphate kinase n=1 Tax=Pseudomonas phage AH05 TaxID=2869574 RepID=A0AAE7X244_9CAUD|nr:deoxynucleoside monophosphate kinase [Pseudomonas phage AH05]UAV89321.1 kinase [Pseudomonas phage ALEA]UAV89470.1 kinase [Pseudomonas phage M1.1]UAV89519.1 kinase [Pseudomonas phage M1.2]UAV89568.1 kinase [Pseudomonas phage M3.1]UAV89791.1 kinase [Pseudomonas phage NOI]
MSTIIALTSRRGRSGKDTLVEKLREEGFEVYRVAFGDVLKHQCSLVLCDDRQAQIVMESHCHTDLKDAAFEELSINNIPESAYSDWLRETFWDDTAPRSPRWHLQQYGTGYRRNHMGEPDVWLNGGLKEIAKAPEGSLVVVTDMRQANEYHALNAMGAHLVRLTRNWVIEAVDSAPLHATDIELESFDMDAHVENRWGYPDQMLDQLRNQGVIE